VIDKCLRNAVLCMLLAAGSLMGCRTTLPDCRPAAVPEYALVEYRFGGELGRTPSVEVSQTPTYDQQRTQFAVAAVRLPDSCLNEGAARVSGVASQAQSILQTHCGPWLGEIERALVRAKFRVMSWDAVWKLEKQENLSTYNAAKELGAEIVFVFNSLEAADVTAGAIKTVSYKYFQSDSHGERGAPLPLDDAARAAFRSYVSTAVGGEAQARSVVALSSVLDVTAIMTGSGESIWFYRRAVVVPTVAQNGMRLLFARVRPGDDSPGVCPSAENAAECEALGRARQWLPTVPEIQASVAAPVAPVLRTEDVSTSSVGPASDPYASERLAIIRAGAEHFVSSFRTGGKDGGR
jgi:hypothetical protein